MRLHPIKKFPNKRTLSKQSGGVLLGIVLGLLVGIGLALGVAYYITKSQPQEKPGIRAPSLPPLAKPSTNSSSADEEVSIPTPQIDLNKPLQTKVPGANTAPDPIADIANNKSGEAVFYIQTGVFSKRNDADSQKANLAMEGIQSQLSESAVDGNALWRVRIGPFASIEDTTTLRGKLSLMGIKPAVIKVNNP
ncbi:MAG: SPOR domain-containing protein [Polynucleobacter sp.]|jgi:cell division protein FtsN|nr:SPOR domain-containing protein [Polynucleobacter sp.]